MGCSIYDDLWMLRADIIANVIPINWCKKIRKDNSPEEPDIIACLILANIISWYLPIKEIDVDMEIIHFFRYGERLNGNKLKRDYQYYSKYLGVPDTDARDALKNLIRLNLITEEFIYSHLETEMDNIISYIEPIIDNVFNITWPEEHNAKII